MTVYFSDEEWDKVRLEVESLQLHLESIGVDLKEAGLVKMREAMSEGTWEMDEG